MLLAETCAIAVGKLRQRQSGRDYLDVALDAITAQGVVHDARWGNHRVHRITLAPRQPLRQLAPERRRQPRRITVDVFGKQRVVGAQHRLAITPRQRHAGIVGGKRRLDVDQVIAVRVELPQLLAQGAAPHQPVFRVKRQIVAGHAHNLLLGIVAVIVLRIGRRQQSAADAELPQHAAKAAD